MSEAEIISFFKKAPAHVCGKLRSEQLTRYNLAAPNRIRPGRALLMAGFAGIITALTATHSLAQVTSPNVKIERVVSPPQPLDSLAVGSAGISIHGTVLSAEDHSALPGVNVTLKGWNVSVATDAKGKFEFPQPVKVGDELIFSFIGLRTGSVIIKPIVNNEANVELAINYEMTEELLYLGGIRVETRLGRIWRKAKSIF